MRIHPVVLASLMCGSALFPFAAYAQVVTSSIADQQPGGAQQDTDHPERDVSIVVSGILPSTRLDALSGVAILQGAELVQSIRPSIGDTLARTPGVSASSFGPSASRPVLRGLQG